MRATMQRQLADWEPVKVLRSPLKPPHGAPMMLSNPGVIAFPPHVIDGFLHEVIGNVNPEDTSEYAFLATQQTLKYTDRFDQWVYTHFNTMLTSKADGEAMERMLLKGLQRLTLDMTVRNALKAIEPAIKEAL
jgi:hypothetical protein